MADPIQGITQVGRADAVPELRQPQRAKEAGTRFADVLTEAVGEVQRLHEEADTTIRKLVSGEIKDITQAIVAVEKADLAFQTMMTVRNKVIAAYEEINRMQV